MSNYVYETHIVDSLLPFIIHTDAVKSHEFSRPNWHSNIELLYCISGEGEAKLNSVSCNMRPGDVIVINSNVIHGTCAQDRLVYHCLIIDNSFCCANGLDVEKLKFQHYIQDKEIAQAMVRIAQNYACWQKSKALCYSLEIRHDVLGILCVLYSRYQQPMLREENFLATQRVKTVVTFVRQNLASQLSLDVLAAHAGVSKFHLSREFKSTTGLTIVTFINLCRCTEARRLIEDGVSVCEAAIACGFENMSYFTRTFKKFFDCVSSAFSAK